jgi:hypothetical protein
VPPIGLVQIGRAAGIDGTLRGDQGASKVTITVVSQADASIQVGFAVSGGGAAQDANVKEHLTRAYQRRMGR